MVLKLLVFFGHQRQQLLNFRLLSHGVDEFVTDQVELVDLAFAKGVQHDLDAANQGSDGRCLTQITSAGDHIATMAVEKRTGFGTQQAQIYCDTLVGPGLHGLECGLEHVDVQATTQTAVTGDNDVAHPFDFALFHVAVLVFGVGVGQVTDHGTHALGIGLAPLHTLLSFTHLTRGDHFHRAGNFLRAFNARNLRPNLFCACHTQRPSSVNEAVPFGTAGLTRSGWI